MNPILVIARPWYSAAIGAGGIARVRTDIVADTSVIEWITGLGVLPRQIPVPGHGEWMDARELLLPGRAPSRLAAEKNCKCLHKRLASRLAELERSHA